MSAITQPRIFPMAAGALAAWLAPLPLSAETARHLGPVRYACKIEMICAGIWSDCRSADLAGTLEVPPDGAPLLFRMAGETAPILFETVTPGSTDGAISASGTVEGRYSVLTFTDHRVGIVNSVDRQGDGLFRANGSFAGSCEAQP